MITAEATSKTHGGPPMLREVSGRRGRAERVGFVGPNGAGKTAFCRILAGLEEPGAGRGHRDRGVTVGSLPQEGTGGAGLTVLAEALAGFDCVGRLEARLAEIERALAEPDLYRDGARARAIAQTRKESEEPVAWLMEEWEELSLQLAPGPEEA
jgi:ATP-binding cassette subfamily F protein 3